jgi:hypothetical protein
MDGLRMLREEECVMNEEIGVFVVVRDLDRIRRGLWLRERETQ